MTAWLQNLCNTDYRYATATPQRKEKTESMLKIILTGPESCGKTTLAQELAAHFQVPLVEEYVRQYFEKKGTPRYEEADLKEIAVGQINAEKSAEHTLNQAFISKKNNRSAQFIICDTDILTIKIWAEEKYGRCDAWLLQQCALPHFERAPQTIIAKGQTVEMPYFEFQNLKNVYLKMSTLYVLCSPEGIAWAADPLREHAHDRDRLFDIYEQNLIFYQKNYHILRGSISERFETACALVHRQLALIPPF